MTVARTMLRLALVGVVASLLASCGSPEPAEPVALGLTIGTPAVPAELVIPRGATGVPAVVMLSGAGPNDMDESVGAVKPLRDIAYGLAQRGVASIRFDKATRATGAVPGPGFTPTAEYVDYARAAFDRLVSGDVIDPQKIFVLGHSYGGTLAPRVIQAQPAFAGMVLLAAPATDLPTVLLRHFRHLASLGGDLGRIAQPQVQVAQELLAEVGASPRARVRMRSPLAHEAIGRGVTGSYFLDVRGYDAVAAGAALAKPTLLVQGERDWIVSVDDDLQAWITGLRDHTDLTVHRYPLATHTMVDGTGVPSPLEYERPGHVNQQVIDDIADWVQRLR